MEARLTSALLAALLLIACGPGPSSPPTGGLRVLFIGNSLTGFNDLPSMVEAMGNSAGLDVSVTAMVVGGFALQDHWNQGDVLDTIRAGGPWDFVIMQQGPSGLPASRVNLVEWAGRFGTEIRQVGAVPVMYMVWPDGSRMTAFDSVSMSYRAAAIAAGGPVAPAGEAWTAAWSRRQSLALYGEDNFHPSELGSYLAALTISAVIFERPAESFPVRITVAGRTVVVDGATAAVLRAAVNEVR